MKCKIKFDFVSLLYVGLLKSIPNIKSSFKMLIENAVKNNKKPI